MLLAAFPTCRIPVVAATACVVPFLLDPAAALACMSPWHMKLQRLDLVAAFLLGVSSAVSTRQPPTASMLARFRLPAWSSVHAWLLSLRTGSDSAPERCLPAPDPVLHASAPVRRGAVADACLGLAACPIFFLLLLLFVLLGGCVHLGQACLLCGCTVVWYGIASFLADGFSLQC